MSRLSLFEKVLGDGYARLPAAVQRFHRLSGHTVLHGWVETQAPETLLARALAVCLGAPRSASTGPIRFELTSGPAEETWTRYFPTRTMTSCMRLVAGHVEESLGSARLTFNLVATEGRLSMQLAKMRFFGVPCPTWMLPRIVAEERGTDDQLHFRITAELPFVGRVASYRGHLEVRMKESA